MGLQYLYCGTLVPNYNKIQILCNAPMFGDNSSLKVSGNAFRDMQRIIAIEDNHLASMLLLFQFHLGKMLHQHPMNENVTSTNLLHENAIISIVKEASVVPGNIVFIVKDNTQAKVFDARCSTTY